MKNKLFVLLSVVLLVCSCGGKGKKSYDEMGSNGLTQRTENLQANLHTFVNNGTIIGQKYGTLEGIGWREDSTRHGDINSISGDYPGVNAYEISGIESGKKVNPDGISFDAIRCDVLDNFRHGCLTVMTWKVPYYHENDQKFKDEIKHIVDFFDSLQDGYGIKAPVLFFPFPKVENAWYSTLTPDAYNRVYRDVMEAMEDNEVSNIIYGFSFSMLMSASDLNLCIPDGVDVIDFTVQPNQSMKKADGLLTEMLKVMRAVSEDRNLVPALTLNLEGVKDSTYFSKKVLPIIHQYRLSYVCFGANYGDDAKDGHYCVPFPGCSNALIRDFMTLYNDKSSIFRSKLNGLYLKK